MRKSYKLVLILTGVISMFLMILCSIRNGLKVDSIGIIGGADGPTSIMISKTSDSSVLLYIITGVISIGFITLMVIAFKKKRN